MFREEVKRRRRQLRELCRAVRVDTIPELQELLCAMVLAECVYKVRSRLRSSPVPRFRAFDPVRSWWISMSVQPLSCTGDL
jgi:hypothetical protein